MLVETRSVKKEEITVIQQKQVEKDQETPKRNEPLSRKAVIYLEEGKFINCTYNLGRTNDYSLEDWEFLRHVASIIHEIRNGRSIEKYYKLDSDVSYRWSHEVK